MTDNTDFTKTFFDWAKNEGLSSQDIADELGKSRVVISNWRSKGTPVGHYYACRSYMEKVARKNKRKPTK